MESGYSTVSPVNRLASVQTGDASAVAPSAITADGKAEPQPIVYDPRLKRDYHGKTVTGAVAAGLAFIKGFRPEVERALLEAVASATDVAQLKFLFGGQVEDSYFNSVIDAIYGDTNSLSDLRFIAARELELTSVSAANLSDSFEVPAKFAAAYLRTRRKELDRRDLYLAYTQRVIKGELTTTAAEIRWLMALAGSTLLEAHHVNQVLRSVEPAHADLYILERIIGS